MARTEIWKTIPGYEGLYEISNFGRVKTHCAGRGRNVTKIRKLVPDKDGYLTVMLTDHGRAKNMKVHRLVAEAFIDNPNNYPMINHKDECKSNNSFENLEWCDSKYNNSYGTKPSKFFKRVMQFSRDGLYIRTFESINSAAAFMGVSPSTISTAISGRRRDVACGYIWRKE